MAAMVSLGRLYASSLIYLLFVYGVKGLEEVNK